MNIFRKKNNNNQVLLVDNEDNIIMIKDKQYAHIKCLLHRAVSIFIFNKKDELLIQQRSVNKYHSALLWSNTCCGHPMDYETVLDSAHRCLKEEMGFDCFLNKKFHFIYKSRLSNGLFEYEFDHIFTGRYEGFPNINYEEVANWNWISLEDLLKDIYFYSCKYSTWFKILLNKYLSKIKL